MGDTFGLCGQRLRVLVADDDVDGLESLAALLRLWGHEAVTAADGPSALRAAEAAPPDVALLDVVMPEMSGLEVAGALAGWHRARRPFLVALTGCADEGSRLRCAEAGFDLHLAKPADPEFIEKLLRRFSEFMAP